MLKCEESTTTQGLENRHTSRIKTDGNFCEWVQRKEKLWFVHHCVSQQATFTPCGLRMKQVTSEQPEIFKMFAAAADWIDLHNPLYSFPTIWNESLKDFLTCNSDLVTPGSDAFRRKCHVGLTWVLPRLVEPLIKSSPNLLRYRRKGWSQFIFMFTFSRVLNSRMSLHASWSRWRCSSVLGCTTWGSVLSSASSSGS